jgi:tripartite-type tricarboxylate transporter receptor subunit TctC
VFGEAKMKKLPRRQFLRFAGLAAAMPAVSRTAFAETYPARPIKWVVPFPAGGTTDLLARVLSQPLSERLGQQIIVENKPGGGTNIAVQQVVNSAPDGYTLLMTLATNTINPSLYKSLPFDFARDIVPISGLAELPLVLASIRACRPRTSPSSSPTPGPIRASSASPRSARAPSAIWRSS